MILDELELEKSEELAQRLWIQENYQAFAFAPWHDETGEPLRATMDYSGDEEFLEAWMKDLRW
jgi:hypothetical protein